MRRGAVVFVAMITAASAAAAKPDWLERPPASDRTYIYVVGEASGRSVAEAQEAALKDAVGKLAAQINTVVSARTISTLSNTESAVLSETRQSVRARVREAEVVGAPWIKVAKRGIWPFRRPKSFEVAVLVRFPRAAMARERARQENAWSEYKVAVNRLAHELGEAIGRSSGHQVAVSGFIEATTRRSYVFGEIVQRDLADALTRARVGVVPLTKAEIVVNGAFREIGGQVVVTARLVRRAGERLAVAEASFDRDAVPDQWLEIAGPTDHFFESTEPQRGGARARFGTISVQTTQGGMTAEVFVDGDLRGKTPAALGGIPVGRRSVTVALPGYEPHIEQVNVVEAETCVITAKLKPLTGSLELRSAPTGASVFDGARLLGKTPLKLADLAIGVTHLIVRLPDYQETAIDAAIEAKKTTLAKVTLAEQPGSLLVISDPPGAEISVDGVEVGVAKAPKFLKIERLAAGTHQVTARKKGLGVWGGEVTIRANKTETTNAVLRNNLGILAISVVPPNARINVDGQAIEDPAAARPGRGDVANVDDLLKTLPGVGEHVSGRRRAMTIEGLRRNSETGRITIPLEAGEHFVTFSALGYQGEHRKLTIKPGKTKRLRLELIEAPEDRAFVNDSGAHLFHELMPWTKDYVDMCRRGDESVAVKAAACTITFPIATVMTLGLYPLVGDIVTFPYHGVKALAKRLPDREGEKP